MQQVVPHPSMPTAYPDIPDLTRYDLFIHLGTVQTPGRLELARQALGKTMRCWQGSARLLVAVEDGYTWSGAAIPPHCGFHSRSELRRTMQRNGTEVLVPAFSDPQGDITLHAIASGVPLGALNLASLASETATAFPQDGSAFLAVARTARQAH